MSTTELTALCTQYKELQRLKEEITAEMETVADTIKAAMGTTEKLVAGQYKIMYTTVNGSRLDTTKLKKGIAGNRRRIYRFHQLPPLYDQLKKSPDESGNFHQGNPRTEPTKPGRKHYNKSALPIQGGFYNE